MSRKQDSYARCYHTRPQNILSNETTMIAFIALCHQYLFGGMIFFKVIQKDRKSSSQWKQWNKKMAKKFRTYSYATKTAVFNPISETGEYLVQYSRTYGHPLVCAKL